MAVLSMGGGQAGADDKSVGLRLQSLIIGAGSQAVEKCSERWLGKAKSAEKAQCTSCT
jgi:hypothetical protein